MRTATKTVANMLAVCMCFRTNSHLQPSAIKRFTRSQKMTLASLALVDFISFCSMSIMAPFFPKEASEKDMSNTLSGFVFSFYALVMFLTSPVFGKIVSCTITNTFLGFSINSVFAATKSRGEIFVSYRTIVGWDV